MKTTKIIIATLLVAAVVFMAFICVNSVVTPIKFEEARTQREVKVINNLVSLRTAQAQWRLDKGYFTADLDSLIDYLKVTPKKEVYKVGFLTEMQLENGLTENKAAKILERARLKAQRKMKFQGPDSLSMLYNYIWENDGEVKSEGLQGFRRDTILTNMIQSIYKGQYTEETIGEIVYIPYTDNVKFEVETNNGYTTSQGIKVPIWEIRAHYNTYLHDLNSQERINLIDKEEKLGHYPGLKIGSVEVPNNNVGSAFYGCSSLNSVTIPNSVTSIGEGAFSGCSSLNSVIIPNSVTSIGEYAFRGCSSLNSIIIPNSVTSIGKGAFYGCSSLTSINIPNSVTSIGKGAFYKCSSLDSITIPADISMTDNYADSVFPPLPPPPPPPVQKEDVLNVVEDEVEEVMAVDPTNDEGDEMVYMVVETMPEFPGGVQAMMRFISENLQYPPAAQENGIQGRAICQFVIEKDGSITDIVVGRTSGHASLDEEAIRVISRMPNWEPGKQRGKPVRVKYTVPVNFRLQ
jgi:TonB family protein